MMAAMTNSHPPSQQSANPEQPDSQVEPCGGLWNAKECLAELDCNGEPEILGEVIAAFVEDGGRRLAKLRQAATGGQLAELRSQAHSLKGSSSQIAARRMATLCQHIEQCSSRPGSAEIPLLVDQLEDAFRSTCETMLAFAEQVTNK